jgi:hypothetical protein
MWFSTITSTWFVYFILINKIDSFIFRLIEDIKSLGSKYPDFDMVDLQATTSKNNTVTQRCMQVLTGHHYYPTLSTFYPTDFLHSSILTIYLLVMCGLW